jgi:class 3 adenylate cyclase/predicted ATPase
VDIGAWLRGLGLEQYEQAFRDSAIDSEILPRLTVEDLKDIGVSIVGHRRKLLEAIAVLREAGEPGSPSAIETRATRSSVLPSAPPSSHAERRQLTVMFVDLVGSTALAHRLDPEEMGQILRAYQDAVAGVVARFEGQVAKFMGDGILAHFGWPKAYEDAAERAVRAGLAIARAVPKLNVSAGCTLVARVGIATGLVVVGDLVGKGAAQEEAVVGETPNLAARLQQIARPGTVVISDPTRRLVGGLFEVEQVAPHAFKGFSEPLRAYRVLGEGQAEDRFEALHGADLAPLVGRQQELALLLERWERAKDGEGQVVLLAGEPGIGKSRITLALRERLGAEARMSLRYHGSPCHTNTALFPIIDQLERASGFARGDTPEVMLAKLEALLGEAVADSRSAVPLIAEHLAIPTGDRFSALELAAEQKRAQTFRALLAQIEGRAAKKPVLMTAEDAHWFDPTSLDLFDLIVDRIERLPILLVVTFRPEFAPRWTGRPHVTLLTLNRLGRSEGAALVGHLAGGKPLPAEVQAHILAKTEGVRLFVEELTKAVLESGLLRDAGERYELAGERELLAIPSTLQDSLMARLDRLASVKHIAQVAAAIGREFSFDLLRAVTGLSEEELQVALDQLVASALVFRGGTPPEVAYSFKHALIQDAAYQSLLKSRRQELHQRIAAALERRLPQVVQTEPELLARHYTEAGLAEPAIRYWLRAAQLASRRSANRETIAHCQKALALIAQNPETPERDRLELELRVVLGPAMMVMKGFAAHEISEVYTRARELCRTVGQPSQVFAVLYGLWLNQLFKGQLKIAQKLATELLALAQERSDEDLLLQGHHANWTTFFYLANLRSCLKHARKGIELYDFDKHRHHAFIYGGHDPGVCCRGSAAESLWYLGYPDQALQSANDAVRLARQLSHPFSELQALLFLAHLHRGRREVESTRQDAEAVAKLSANHGIGPHYASMAKAFCGWALVCAGAIREGIEQVCQGIEGYRITEGARGIPRLLALLADARLHAGESDDGLVAAVEGLARAEENSEHVWVPELLCLKGQLLLSRSAQDAGGAESCFERALDAARGLDARLLELRAATSLARLWAERGERPRAHDLLAPIYGWFTEGFDTPDLKDAKLLLDALN